MAHKSTCSSRFKHAQIGPSGTHQNDSYEEKAEEAASLKKTLKANSLDCNSKIKDNRKPWAFGRIATCGNYPVTLSSVIVEHMILPARRLKKDLTKDHSFDDILLMLHACNWREHEVRQQYEKNPSAFLKWSGIAKQSHYDYINWRYEPFSCKGCFWPHDEKETFGLFCLHRRCQPCYGSYVRSKLRSDCLISCINRDCSLKLLHKDVNRLWVGQSFSSRDVQGEEELNTLAEKIALEEAPPVEFRVSTRTYYLSKIEHEALDYKPLQEAAKKIIDKTEGYTWCPFDCQHAVKLEEKDFLSSLHKENRILAEYSRVTAAKCASGHEFCLSCRGENHLPCPCSLSCKYVCGTVGKNNTAVYIATTVRKCPSCKAPIERNDACSTMYCKCGRFLDWFDSEVTKTMFVDVVRGKQIYFKTRRAKNFEKISRDISKSLSKWNEDQVDDGRNVIAVKTEMINRAQQCLIESGRLEFWTRVLLSYSFGVLKTKHHKEGLMRAVHGLKLSMRRLCNVLKSIQSSLRGQSEQQVIAMLSKIGDEKMNGLIAENESIQEQITKLTNRMIKEAEIVSRLLDHRP